MAQRAPSTTLHFQNLQNPHQSQHFDWIWGRLWIWKQLAREMWDFDKSAILQQNCREATELLLCNISQSVLERDAPGTWHVAPGTWHLEPGTCYLELGTGHLALGTCHLALCTWHLAPDSGTWHLVSGTWHLIPSTWRLICCVKFHNLAGMHLAPAGLKSWKGAF